MKIGIDLVVEDYVRHMNECARKVRTVFLLEKPWNKDKEIEKNVVRVNNWRKLWRSLETEENECESIF